MLSNDTIALCFLVYSDRQINNNYYELLMFIEQEWRSSVELTMEKTPYGQRSHSHARTY